MPLRVLTRVLAVICVATLATGGQAWAQSAAGYTPQVGQEGKDVVWVPTAQALVDRMLDMAKATPKDYVIDLGSGDGRTVITAAKRGIKAHGIEYNPEMVELAKHNAQAEGVADKATFIKADIFESDFSQATVLTLFLLTELNIRLRPTILTMKPGTRVVSNTFSMGDWTPDEVVQAGEGCSSFCRASLWIVPAPVEGTWQVGQSELVLEQKYQMIAGKLRTGNVIAPITNGKVTGDRIAFTAGGAQYAGVVNGNSIEGTSQAGSGETRWQATRAAK
ncbi:MAG: class I SAM-dependent methyltransferase [Hyphomonadaceae bacterium]|nr:class I SAM-dependent methyltransferase [Hyphomonadaceae bacterium]